VTSRGRGRVVVVVGGVMSIRGDGNTAYKAKDHSRDAQQRIVFSGKLKVFPKAGDELGRDGEPDALKGARPVREGLY